MACAQAGCWTSFYACAFMCHSTLLDLVQANFFFRDSLWQIQEDGIEIDPRSRFVLLGLLWGCPDTCRRVCAHDASLVVSKVPPMYRFLPLKQICVQNFLPTVATPGKIVKCSESFGVRSALADSKTALRSPPGLFLLASSRYVLIEAAAAAGISAVQTGQSGHRARVYF